jgi:hypothetical protein
LLLLLLLLLQHEIAHGTKLHECEHRFKDTIINAQKPLRKFDRNYGKI